MMLALALASAALALVITRGGFSRRAPAALIPVALWLLITPPAVPWPGAAPVELAADASLADVEAARNATASGSTIRVGGDGLHPDFVPLLDDRVLRWSAPSERVGLAALEWPRRVAIGEPVHITGRIDAQDSVIVRLSTPDGSVDSLRTNGDFDFAVVPGATGRWLMSLAVGGATHTLGLHVIATPRLRVLVVAGRPDFEVPALVRRLRAQDADVTVRTQVTRDRSITEALGVDPPSPRITATSADSLDLVVLAAGASATLGANEQRALAAAVERGLGVLHLLDAPVRAGALAPFALRASGAEWSTRLAFEGTLWPGVVRVSPLAGPDSLAYLRDSTGRALAWRTQRGAGVIAMSALTQAHRWTLAGHPESEATWWSALLGPVLRAPSGQWLVANDALIRADEPFVARWVGGELPNATVHEGTASSGLHLHREDSISARVRLWPRDTGWLSLASEDDTLDLWVAPREAFHGIAMAARREVMSRVAGDPSGSDPTGRRPLPPTIGWLLLVGAVAAAWRPR